jgi:epoxyqueuosine reductase
MGFSADKLFIDSLREEAARLGFAGLSITTPDLGEAEAGLLNWLNAGMAGEMDYMSRYGVDRARAASFVPGATTVLSVRMDYWPEAFDSSLSFTDNPDKAYVARYALGRDYHKVIRNRLQDLADWMTTTCGAFSYRVFTDSAPLMEVALAANAGLGWRGKHTLLLHREHGSAFFLGEIICDLPLPADAPIESHCGTCQACIDICPTQAIIAPYQLDARRCISYLTIEHKTSIPVEFRKAIGNRIYGCDDCQLVCPWNKYAKVTQVKDFAPRNGLENSDLITLFNWTREQFETRMEGTAIRRIGYERWLRNLAIGLGNAPSTPEIISALRAREHDESALLREHVAWALAEHNLSEQI